MSAGLALRTHHVVIQLDLVAVQSGTVKHLEGLFDIFLFRKLDHAVAEHTESVAAPFADDGVEDT